MLKILPLAEAGSAIAAVRARLDVFEKESSARSATLTRKVFGQALSPAQVVERIVNDVRRRGDDAVAEYTLRLDGAILTPDMFRVEPALLLKAEKHAAAPFLAAVRFAAANVREYQESLLISSPKEIAKLGRGFPLLTSSRTIILCYVPV